MKSISYMSGAGVRNLTALEVDAVAGGAVEAAQLNTITNQYDQQGMQYQQNANNVPGTWTERYCDVGMDGHFRVWTNGNNYTYHEYSQMQYGYCT